MYSTYILRVSFNLLSHSRTVCIKLFITDLQQYASVLISRTQSIEYLDQIQTIKQCQRPEDEKEIMQKRYSHLCFPKCTRILPSLQVSTFRSLFLLSLVVLTLFIPPMLCTHFYYDFTFEGYKEFTFYRPIYKVQFVPRREHRVLPSARPMGLCFKGNNYLLLVTRNTYIHFLDKTDSLYC